MNDREFLGWLHNRLEHQYHVNRHVDWMTRLRAISATIPPDQHTTNVEPKVDITLYGQKA